MTDTHRPWRPAPLVVVALVVLAVAGTVALVALVAGPLLGTPTGTIVNGQRLEYRVDPGDGVAPAPDDVEAVAAVMRRRLEATGALFAVEVLQPDRIGVDVAVGVHELDAVDALLAARGQFAIVPLGPEPVDVGAAVDPALAPVVTNDQVTAATARVDQTSLPTLDIVVDEVATEALAAWTRGHVGEYGAITLDGAAIAVPLILEPIEGGEVQLSLGPVSDPWGDLTQRLVTILKFGPLPVPVTRINAAP